MAEPEIISKLNKVLSEDITNEYQVVYILSRIRKLLEFKNKKGVYKYLNFYCNWALHTNIDRTEPVAEVLRDFINDEDDGRFLSFDHLVSDLQRFITDYGIISGKLFEADNYLRFVNLLVDIYADTPVEVCTKTKRVITLIKPTEKIKNSVFSISYHIE